MTDLSNRDEHALPRAGGPAAPLVRWMLSDRGGIFAVILALLACWAAAGVAFGLAGIVLPAVAVVPLVFIGLILISRG